MLHQLGRHSDESFFYQVSCRLLHILASLLQGNRTLSSPRHTPNLWHIQRFSALTSLLPFRVFHRRIELASYRCNGNRKDHRGKEAFHQSPAMRPRLTATIGNKIGTSWKKLRGWKFVIVDCDASLCRKMVQGGKVTLNEKSCGKPICWKFFAGNRVEGKSCKNSKRKSILFLATPA